MSKSNNLLDISKIYSTIDYIFKGTTNFTPRQQIIARKGTDTLKDITYTWNDHVIQPPNVSYADFSGLVLENLETLPDYKDVPKYVVSPEEQYRIDALRELSKDTDFDLPIPTEESIRQVGGYKKTEDLLGESAVSKIFDNLIPPNNKLNKTTMAFFKDLIKFYRKTGVKGNEVDKYGLKGLDNNIGFTIPDDSYVFAFIAKYIKILDLEYKGTLYDRKFPDDIEDYTNEDLRFVFLHKFIHLSNSDKKEIIEYVESGFNKQFLISKNITKRFTATLSNKVYNTIKIITIVNCNKFLSSKSTYIIRIDKQIGVNTDHMMSSLIEEDYIFGLYTEENSYKKYKKINSELYLLFISTTENPFQDFSQIKLIPIPNSFPGVNEQDNITIKNTIESFCKEDGNNKNKLSATLKPPARSGMKGKTVRRRESITSAGSNVSTDSTDSIKSSESIGEFEKAPKRITETAYGMVPSSSDLDYLLKDTKYSSDSSDKNELTLTLDDIDIENSDETESTLDDIDLKISLLKLKDDDSKEEIKKLVEKRNNINSKLISERNQKPRVAWLDALSSVKWYTGVSKDFNRAIGALYTVKHILNKYKDNYLNNIYNTIKINIINDNIVGTENDIKPEEMRSKLESLGWKFDKKNEQYIKIYYNNYILNEADKIVKKYNNKTDVTYESFLKDIDYLIDLIPGKPDYSIENFDQV